MATVLAGCVVSDPPEYGVARQTPPFLDANGASPSVLLRLDLKSGQSQTFNVPIRSEDAGEALLAQLFLDYNVTEGAQSKQRILGFRQVPASTLDDTKNRSISIPWTVQGVAAGCHPVSLVVTHVGNLDKDTNLPKNADDTAILTWWANIDDTETDPNKMSSCPVLGGTQ